MTRKIERMSGEELWERWRKIHPLDYRSDPLYQDHKRARAREFELEQVNKQCNQIIDRLEDQLATLKEENERLKSMIDYGIGWEDLKDDTK